MIAPAPIVIDIAARVGPDYGLGQKVAQSLVRKVLELSVAESPAGWSRDDHCPPEALRGPCRDDCAACYAAAAEAIRRMELSSMTP